MKTMQHLVVGTDGSPDADRAVAWAASQLSAGHVTVVHGFRPAAELFAAAVQIDLGPVRTEHLRLLESTWSEPARAAAGPEVTVTTELVEDQAARALTFVADQAGADAIVVGHRGGAGIGHNYTGATLARLLHHASLPVIVTNDATSLDRMSGTAVVALSQPSEEGSPELTWAIDAAQQFGLDLHLVTVVEPVAFVDGYAGINWVDVTDAMAKHLGEMTTSLAERYPDITFTSEVGQGPITRSLAAAAEKHGASLVVAGSHHPGHLSALIGGSLPQLAPSLLPCALVAIPV